MIHRRIHWVLGQYLPFFLAILRVLCVSLIPGANSVPGIIAVGKGLTSIAEIRILHWILEACRPRGFFTPPFGVLYSSYKDANKRSGLRSKRINKMALKHI